jgi:hypothetical protein
MRKIRKPSLDTTYACLSQFPASSIPNLPHLITCVLASIPKQRPATSELLRHRRLANQKVPSRVVEHSDDALGVHPVAVLLYLTGTC